MLIDEGNIETLHIFAVTTVVEFLLCQSVHKRQFYRRKRKGIN